jgi:formylglycine-generating enzyme required for sulfatase activity
MKYLKHIHTLIFIPIVIGCTNKDAETITEKFIEHQVHEELLIDRGANHRWIVDLPEGQPHIVSDINMKMVWISPGKFIMGSPTSEPGHQPHEEDLHEVVISKGYWIGQFEVTQAQFEHVLDTNPSKFKDPNIPVHKVNWHEAMYFCETLTEHERFINRLPDTWKFTLPTESQWEYACRADTKTIFHFGNESHRLEQYGWFASNSADGPKPVGMKKPNNWGIYDLHGNMGEWCFDWYGKTYPPHGSVDPITEKGSSFKVFRGGTYTDIPNRSRSAYRNRITPDTRNPWIGFRVVLVHNNEQ